MTTTFIDTNGEMSFVDNERLKFIMHYLKQGADDSLVETKDGRFVREDSELSFTEIWLPAAEHQQRKIDEQQAKVEELQKKLIEHGLICPMCSVAELKEEVFLNDGVECLVSKCAECGIETSSAAQLKINKLVFIGRELQQKLKMALDVIQCGKEVRELFIQKFNAQQVRIDAALEVAEDLMQNIETYKQGERLEQALKGEADGRS